MSLLELTVVILVLLTLITVLFVGAKAWKRGSDRAICIIHIQNVQKGLRSYSNLYGINPGAAVSGLQNQIIGMGRFVENTPICPGNGDYRFGQIHGPDTVPPIGDLYMDCSLGPIMEHTPTEHSDW